MIEINKENLLLHDGKPIKQIHCPKQVALDSLVPRQDSHFDCNQCEHVILNTDVMTERQIIEAVTEDPSVCLRINRANPIFKTEY